MEQANLSIHIFILATTRINPKSLVGNCEWRKKYDTHVFLTLHYYTIEAGVKNLYSLKMWQIHETLIVNCSEIKTSSCRQNLKESLLKHSVPRHHSFVLRMWLENNDARSKHLAWRCVLLDLQNEQRIVFSRTQDLINYLTEQIHAQYSQYYMQDESDNDEKNRTDDISNVSPQ